MVSCFMGKFPIHTSPVRLESLSSRIFSGFLACMALSFLFDFMPHSASYYLGSLFLGRRQGSGVGQREAPPPPPPTLQNKAASRWGKLRTTTATTMTMKKIKRQDSVHIIWVSAGIFRRPIQDNDGNIPSLKLPPFWLLRDKNMLKIHLLLVSDTCYRWRG